MNEEDRSYDENGGREMKTLIVALQNRARGTLMRRAFRMAFRYYELGDHLLGSKINSLKKMLYSEFQTKYTQGVNILIWGGGILIWRAHVLLQAETLNNLWLILTGKQSRS